MFVLLCFFLLEVVALCCCTLEKQRSAQLAICSLSLGASAQGKENLKLQITSQICRSQGWKEFCKSKNPKKILKVNIDFSTSFFVYLRLNTRLLLGPAHSLHSLFYPCVCISFTLASGNSDIDIGFAGRTVFPHLKCKVIPLIYLFNNLSEAMWKLCIFKSCLTHQRRLILAHT